MIPATAQETIDYLLTRQLLPIDFLDELVDDLSRLQSGEEVIKELVQRGGLTTYQQSQLLSGEGDKLCFGPYRLMQPLGEGGMGAVFKAWQPRLDRFVALKFIQLQYLNGNPLALVRFQRESHAIAQLQHPNIIVLYDSDEVDGVPFIALEFVDGMSLTEMVRRNGPLGAKQASEYMRQTALGLQHAFERGFVHRDIKPSNLVVAQTKSKSGHALPNKLTLVTRQDLKRIADEKCPWHLDRIKILDMGLARLNDSLSIDVSEKQITETGAVLGTPDYLAPEQARDSSRVDIRADLYALGCTFYFVLSGQPPFPGGTALEKMLRHQCDEPPPLKSLRRDIPEAVSIIVRKLLAKNPDDRFQTPIDLARALIHFLDNSTPEPESPPTAATIPTLVMPRPAAAAKATEDSASSGQPTSEESLLVSSTDDDSGSWPSIPSIPSQEVDPDSGDVDIEELNWLPVGEVSNRRKLQGRIDPIAKLGGHTGTVSAVAVTTNGHFAATADVDGLIRVWDLKDSDPHEIGRKHRRAEIQSIRFAPNDSKSVVFGELCQGRTALVRWDWKADALDDWGEFTSLGQKGIGDLSFTPDGEMLAAGVGSLALTWKIGNGLAKNRRVQKGIDKPIRAIAISPDHDLLAAAGHDNSLHFWHLGKGNWMNSGVRVNSQIATITTMRYSPDGSTLAMAGLDNRVVLWPLIGESQDSACTLKGHANNVQQIQFIDDGKRLASVSTDGQLLYWDLRTATIVVEACLDLGLAYRVEMSANGTRLVAGFTNGSVGIYDLSAHVPSRARRPRSAATPFHR